jgi:UDP-N-acetylmuramoyl-L-alanyl-D-glutamate--2,6-diaminopimelate ligase
MDLSLTGSQFTVVVGDERIPMETRLAGSFNVANTLVAAAAAAETGLPWDSIAAGAAAVAVVPGRFEIVETPGSGTVVVDYAHSPDGIAAVIAATRRLAGDARVIAVVGAGGDRDTVKRPLMGAAAARADLAVITSDNPRSEDPAAILAEVAAGAGSRGRVIEVLDRREAIRRALSEAGEGDVVLVLGKGHEQGQQFGSETVPFDDREVVREEADRLAGEADRS